MAPLPSRKSLESMKRADLQKICKDYGVRANLKSEALIDLLLETQSPPAPRPAQRAVSTRLPSRAGRAGPSRVSSMIVHDISGDEDNSAEDQPEPVAPVAPARTRKAKELQKRLGVGKPVIAGGQGPRAVTRSSGSSRSRQTRLSRSRTVLESTIEEEPEPTSAVAKANVEDVPAPEPSGETIPSPSTAGNETEQPDIRTLIELAMRPLQEQVQTLKSEVTRIESIKSDIAALQVQISDVSKVQKDMMSEFSALHGLSDLVQSLKEDIKHLRISSTPEQSPPNPSTPKAQMGQTIPPIALGVPPPFRDTASVSPTGNIDLLSQSRLLQKRPMVGGSALGKRHRDSTDTTVEGRDDRDGQSESESAAKVERPAKKKARTGKTASNDDGDKGKARAESSRQIPSLMQGDQPTDIPSNRISPAFTVFTGQEESTDYIEPPPPTDHLPDFFRADSPPESLNPQGSRTTGVTTTSADAIENQPHQFGFSFLPISSTPQNPMYTQNFPYPEPPQSPSPAGPSIGFLSDRPDDRGDIFKSFGLPSPLRRNYGSLQDDRTGFVNPAALSQQGPSGRRRDVSSSEVAAGLGLTTARASGSDAAAGPSDDALSTKKTMYGTELESDTRFGDFGVEGVASGFWMNGGKY
ncbi:hypothetical protein CVT26_010033 [Gymnopilus dilepis]|uniref:Uncharacterized protein n=1 Tax=Gymnopilus dilepis TaxID=231916 RepID=A0A409Y714_9AGAR|nr:hypothetical protein CVT26_010033 [Gymnopilus dilepis]